VHRWLLRQRRDSSATRWQASASRRKFSSHHSHSSHHSQPSPPRIQEESIQGAPTKGSLERFSHSSKDCDTPLDSKSKCASTVLPFEWRRANRNAHRLSCYRRRRIGRRKVAPHLRSGPTEVAAGSNPANYDRCDPANCWQHRQIERAMQ
jgi:hypothetical protein